MEPEPRNVHILYCRGGIQSRENIPRFFGMFSNHATWVVVIVPTA